MECKSAYQTLMARMDTGSPSTSGRASTGSAAGSRSAYGGGAAAGGGAADRTARRPPPPQEDFYGLGEQARVRGMRGGTPRGHTFQHAAA